MVREAAAGIAAMAISCTILPNRDHRPSVRLFARLIDDLLDVSRITSGKVRLRKEIVDVACVLNNAVESIRPLIAERQHQLSLSYRPGLLHVEGDSTRLEQIAVNLLANAAKYTEAGGTDRAGGRIRGW
jgi:signal transduction histidine kinase